MQVLSYFVHLRHNTPEVTVTVATVNHVTGQEGAAIHTARDDEARAICVMVDGVAAGPIDFGALQKFADTRHEESSNPKLLVERVRAAEAARFAQVSAEQAKASAEEAVRIATEAKGRIDTEIADVDAVKASKVAELEALDVAIEAKRAAVRDEKVDDARTAVMDVAP